MVTQKSSTSSIAASSLSPNKPLLIEGKYAGYVAEFSSVDGSLLPVPSRFVPDELLMWGQAPKSLEILVSEESSAPAAADSRTAGTKYFQRRTITVLPGVGCGLDSLDTNRSEEIYNYDCDRDCDDDDVVASSSNTKIKISGDDDDAADNTILRVWHDDTNNVGIMDTILRTTTTTTTTTPSATTAIDNDHSKNSSTTIAKTRTFRLETLFALPNAHRLRVSLDLNVSRQTMHNENCSYRYELSPSSSIKTQWENRYDNDHDSDSLGVNVDDVNGHLDACTVFTLIGKELRLQRSRITDVKQHQQHHPTTTTAATDDERNITLWLPGNVTISTGIIDDHDNSDSDGNNDDSEGWYLEVSLSFPPLDMSLADQSDNANSKTKETSRTVRRKFRGFECTPFPPTYSEKE